MHNHILLYIHIKKGTPLKPGELVGSLGHRADYITLPSGDSIGVFRASTGQARTLLENTPGVTVLPPLHRPIKANHVEAFSCVAASLGEDGHSIAERLYETFGEPWWHPEEYSL